MIFRFGATTSQSSFVIPYLLGGVQRQRSMNRSCLLRAAPNPCRKLTLKFVLIYGSYPPGKSSGVFGATSFLVNFCWRTPGRKGTRMGTALLFGNNPRAAH